MSGYGSIAIPMGYPTLCMRTSSGKPPMEGNWKIMRDRGLHRNFEIQNPWRKKKILVKSKIVREKISKFWWSPNSSQLFSLEAWFSAHSGSHSMNLVALDSPWCSGHSGAKSVRVTRKVGGHDVTQHLENLGVFGTQFQNRQKRVL